MYILLSYLEKCSIFFEIKFNYCFDATDILNLISILHNIYGLLYFDSFNFLYKITCFKK